MTIGFKLGQKREKYFELENYQLKESLHPEIYMCILIISKGEPEKIVDDLDPTEDGEASEEAHCASNEAQLGLGCHLHVSKQKSG